MNRIKKYRGLRRYFHKLNLKTDRFSNLNFTDPALAWFDHWHTHFDWEGIGNTGFKKRRPHLDKLIRDFETLEQKARSLPCDFQLWAMVYDFASDRDALYLHTPNPNQENFPVEIRDLRPGPTLKNRQLLEYLHQLTGFEKIYGNGEQAFCILYKKDRGLTNFIVNSWHPQ